MVMYMNKEWIRDVLFVIVSFILLVLEFVFLLFGDYDLYNSKIYSYELVQTAFIFLCYGFPIAIVVAMNRLFGGKRNYQRKIKNLFILIGVVVASTIVYVATIYKTDDNFDGMFAILYCIWIIICCIALTAYYLYQSKKSKFKS